VKRLEPVLDHGLGLAGDLAPNPPPVWTEPETDYAAPAALAVPVPLAVAARSVVLEEDPVLAPATSQTHDLILTQNGGQPGAICQARLASVRHFQPHNCS
jgi:hypothetical protein